MARIYIIDDEVQVAELFSAAIDSVGIDNQYFTNAREFLAIDLVDTDVVLLDLNMPDIDGIEVIRVLGKNSAQVQLVLISGHDSGVLHSAQQLAQAHSLRVAGSLSKPVSIEKLKRLVIQLSQQQQSNIQQHLAAQHMPDITELKTALREKQLVLHYQPQIDIKSGELHGVEALSRWQHPQRGLIFPDTFIPLAEQHDLMGELTAEVIAQAIEQSCEWQKQGLETNISVNISADNITSLSLPEQLRDLLINNQLDPAMLTLEITESALMGELVTSLDILTRLRMKGFGLSIDDFGTGYSSLSQLHRIPFTELKIDKGFTMSMAQDAESRAIVKTCIMLGQELNMQVVAEGVESAEILRLLEEFGCDIAQGYHIARPMPAADLPGWVRQSALAFNA
jgi:EAL domain-containing protein (putative c-di-GMP-specific phosphodiesterase class I)